MDLHTVGQRIAQARREKAFREQRDIQQKDVAEAVGTTKASVSRWENDVDVPRDATLQKLADYFGVTAAYLRYGITEPVRAVAEPTLREYIPESAEAYFARQRAEAKANETAAPKEGGRRAGNEGK